MAAKRFSGELLREKRMSLGLTQIELANEVNAQYSAQIVDATTISRWEINPHAVPRNNKLVKVAKVLRCRTEELYENLIQTEASTIQEQIDKVLKDNKLVYLAAIDDGKVDDDALTLLMKSWKTSFEPGQNSKEYEDREYAYGIYKELSWETGPFDVICSAWTTYVALLVNYAQEKQIKYSDFNVNIDKEMYHYSDTKHLGYWYKNGGIKEASFLKHNAYHPKSSYYSKYLDDKNIHSEFAKKMAKEISSIHKLSAWCHSVANFMPCPNEAGKEYNAAKGLLPDVMDYLPLFIDKIQKCVSENTGLIYKINEPEISKSTIEKWHKWFIENRRIFFLEEYYYVTQEDDKDILVGIPFFRGQSLKNPMPHKLSEATECLDNIVCTIKNRALKMAYFLEQRNQENKCDR